MYKTIINKAIAYKTKVYKAIMDKAISIIEITINGRVYNIPNWYGGYASYFWRLISKIGIRQNNTMLDQGYIIGNDFELEWSNKDNKVGCILFTEESASKISLIDNLGNRTNVRDIMNKIKILGEEYFIIDGLGYTHMQIHCKFKHTSDKIITDNFNCILSFL